MRLGVLVAIYIAGAVVAIVLLQRVLSDLNDAAETADAAAETIEQLDTALADARAALADAGDPPAKSLSRIVGASGRLREAYDRLGGLGLTRGRGSACHHKIGELLPSVAPDAAWLDEQTLETWREYAPAFASQMAAEVNQLRRLAGIDAVENQLENISRLRWLIIGITIAALAAINVTIILLLRTGEMIVRPVEALVEGSRELARERFEHRVDLDRRDEFGELAGSYNLLAEQLQLNEARKMETLQQLGVTLNHELNNVINIIELQLGSLHRHAGSDEVLTERLTKIRGNLRRIAETVASLREVRRIVLTDYPGGIKMLDLARSTDPAESPDEGEP